MFKIQLLTIEFWSMELDFSSVSDGFEALPPEIQVMLKRKSSRDPNSRFSSKLHMLLNYAGNDAAKQEFIGAGWTEGGNFRINKKRLITIMDIKLNTLNVNLKDLKFQQLHSDQAGWTLWCRDGFAPNSTIDDIAEVKSEKFSQKGEKLVTTVPNDEMQQSKLTVLKDISLGKSDPAQTQLYKKIAISIWDELLDSPVQKSAVSPQEFINASAIRFRASHQKLENAKQILNHVFLYPDQSQLTIMDFAVFLARFGPEETLMQKVGSLLKSSNENGNWLRLTVAHDYIPGENDFYGFFDDVDNNGFVLKKRDGSTIKIYNIVDAPATEPYLIDMNNQKYKSWQDYFILNPIYLPEFFWE